MMISWRRLAGLWVVVLAGGPAAGQTWNGGSGNWSTAANWTPATVPGAGDTAVIPTTTLGRVVTYDAAAGGSLGTLSLARGDFGVLNTLNVVRNLTVTTAVTLGLAGQVNAGAAELRVTPAGGDTTLAVPGGLTVTAGGRLTLTAANDLGTYRTSTIGGAVSMSAGEIVLPTPTGSTGAPTHPVGGPFTMSGGLIEINAAVNSSARFQTLGNFTATGGTVRLATAGDPGLLLNGTTNSLSGVTFTSTGGGAATNGAVFLSRAGNQTLTADAPLPPVAAAAFQAGPFTKTLGHTTAGGTLSVYALSIQNGVAGGTTTLALSSHVTTTSGFNNMLNRGASLPASGAAPTLGVQLGGFTLDVSANGQSWAAPNGGPVTNGVRWNLTSSAADGTLRAAGFNLSAPLSGVGVGANVTLQATGGNGAVLNLTGNPSAVLANSFDSASRVFYSGTAAFGTPAVLSASQPLGRVEVGGAGSGTLSFGTPATLAGELRINGTGVARLSGVVLTLGGAADLAGSGVLNGTTAGSQVAFAGGATGGIAPGTVGTVGTLTLSGTLAPQAISLVATSVSRFDVASAASFDRVNLAGKGVRYDGTLSLTFAYTPDPTNPTSYALFQTPGVVANDFTAVVSNLSPSSYTLAFNPANGLLIVTPVPEPAGLLFAAGLAVVARRLGRRAVG